MSLPAEPPDATSSHATRDAVLQWTLLARAYHRIVNDLAIHLERHDLTNMEFDALAHIARRAGTTQQGLTKRLLVTKGNVTYQLNKLEARGLIERRSSGRANHLHLTSKGRELMNCVVPEQNALQVERFGELTSAEQQAFIRTLRKLLAHRSTTCFTDAPVQGRTLERNAS